MSLSQYRLGGSSTQSNTNGGGDMYKSQYDTDNDGKVNAAEVADNSALFDGRPPEYYLDLSVHTGELPANSLPGSLKVIVESPMTLYASPTGEDSNNGETPSTPMSLRGVIERVVDGYVIDKAVTIQLLDGIYELDALIAIANFAGNASLIIAGNAANNTAVRITNASNQVLSADRSLILFNIIGNARFLIRDLTFAFSALTNASQVTSAHLLYGDSGCRLGFENCRFENEGDYFNNSRAITLVNYVFGYASENLYFKGDFDNGIVLTNNARFSGYTGGSAQTRVHFVGLPNLDVFLNAGAASSFAIGDIAFVGSFTGKKYVITSNCILATLTHPNDFIPGTIDGEVSNWVGHAQNLLADVAFSGSYEDLSDLPTIGDGGNASSLNGEPGSYYRNRGSHTGVQTASTISDFVTQVEAVLNALLGVANGLATLGADGKIPSNQLSPLAITDTFVVNTQAAQLALSAQVGDLVIRSDVGVAYILQAEPASILSNWIAIASPGGGIQSVNGQSGTSITLNTSHIEETTNRQYVTLSDLNKLANVPSNTNNAIAEKENSLGNPTANGYVLSSSINGTRTWVAPGGGNNTVPFAEYVIVNANKTIDLNDHGKTLLVTASMTFSLSPMTENLQVNIRSATANTINFVVVNGAIRDPASGSLNTLSRNIFLQFNKTNNTWYLTGLLN